jgi:transcriptional regulator with XRE-family HTH domain
MNIETANRLYELRKKNGLSQEELADKLGISRQAVSKWERAEASPDTDNLILLARLYGITLDELLNTEDAKDLALENQESDQLEEVVENKKEEPKEKQKEEIKEDDE